MGFLGKIRGKLRFQQGQHMIEYSILLTLVMAGIIIMSRYVIRSWNANLQGWDDSIIDSIEDPMQLVAPKFLACRAGDWTDVICGPVSQLNACTGSTKCSDKREALQSTTYIPFGCNCNLVPPLSALRCTIHSCCCDTPTMDGQCGELASQTQDPLPTNCGTLELPLFEKLAEGKCPEGMQGGWTRCGTDDDSIKRWGCKVTALCSDVCTGPPVEDTRPYNEGGYCVDPPTDDGINVFVDPNHQCTLENCVYRCSPGFIAINGGQACGLCQNPGIEKNIQPTPEGAIPVACKDLNGVPTFWLGGCSNPRQFKSCCLSTP